MSRLGNKARFRAALGLPEEEVATVDPGAMASMGVLKPDPAIAAQPRGYVPALPATPDAPTPSGQTLPDAWNDVSAADIGNPGPEVVAKMGEMAAEESADSAPGSSEPGGPTGTAAALVKGAALRPVQKPSVLMSYAAKLAGPKTTNAPDESLRLRAARAGLKEPVAKYMADAMEGAPDKAKRAADLQQAQRSSALLRALETAGSGTLLAQAVGLDQKPSQIDTEAPIRELMQRRSLEQAEVEAAQAQAKAVRDAAMVDPTSQISRDVQAVLASLPAFAQMPEGQRARISASQVPQIAKLFESSASLGQANRRQTETERHNRQMEGAAWRAAGQRADALADRRQQTLDERQVGGLEFAPGRVPSRQDAEKMKGSVERVNAILNNLDRMQEVYDAKGAEVGWGADRAKSESSRREALLQLKELENLGVLQKIDVDQLSQIIPDPNSLRGALDKAGTNEQFANFNRQLRETVAAKATARGYQVADPRLREGGGTITVTNGSETLQIDPSDLAEAEADGFRAVR